MSVYRTIGPLVYACYVISNCDILCLLVGRRDVPVGVPLDLSTPTGMSCIGTYGEN